MQLTVFTMKSFLERLQAFGRKEVGVSQTFSRVDMVAGVFVHFGLVEFSTYGAYEVHFVECVGVKVTTTDEIPDDLVKATKDFADGFKNKLNAKMAEEHQGYGHDFTFIDGVFGDAIADKIFLKDIKPMQLTSRPVIDEIEKLVKAAAAAKPEKPEEKKDPHEATTS